MFCSSTEHVVLPLLWKITDKCCIAGKFDRALNLAVWWSELKPPKSANIIHHYILHAEVHLALSGAPLCELHM